MTHQSMVDIPRRRRVRVPSVLQMEMLECGAACLAMILGFFGQFVPLSTLREESQVSRDGATALQIAKVARARGLSAKGRRLDLPELDTIRTPFIAYWGFNHFVVIEGWGRQGVFLNDPATGPRRVSWQEMDRQFTGVAIEFAVTDAFAKSKKPPSVFTRLPRMLQGFRWPLIFAAILGIFYALPGIATAGFVAFFINTILGQQQLGLAAIFLVGVAVAILLQVGFGWLQASTLARTSVAFSSSLAAQLAWRILRLPMRFFTQRSAGEVSYRMNMPSELAAQLSGPLPQALVSVFAVLLYFIAMASISWLAALTALVIGMLNFLLLRLVLRRQREGQELMLQEQGKVMGEVASALSNIEFIKSTGAEDESFNRFTAFQAKVTNTRQSLLWLTTLLSTVPHFLSLLASAAVIAIGAFAVLNGTLGIGGLVALQILLAGFLTPLITFVQLGGSLNSVGASMVKIDDVLDQPPTIDGIRILDAEKSASRKLAGRIEFRNVTFGYSKGAPPLLSDLSFTVEPGHRIAFVGTSGAGKSTISKLLCGLEEPWSGDVLFDGVPRSEIPDPVMNASLSLVDQSVVLFPGTVTENLTLWDPSIPMERAIAGARSATIHEVIAARPDGYDAQILEGARNFSGGQAQRIEIARALATDPSILILDEATSALDAATEVTIDNSIRQRGCTTVVIAHRLSTIRDADLILVLDQGSVVESGTHDELMANAGLYRTLVES